jgi:uncharacterized integral membrane protein (TIGR00698 family)
VPKSVVSFAPGLAFVAVATAVASLAGWRLSAPGSPVPLSSLTLGVLLGMVVANLVVLPPRLAPGIQLVAKTVLRLAIVLMGLRLTFNQIAAVGPQALLIVAVGSGLTFAFTLVLGRRWKVPVKRTLLLASGTSVCGAAAIAAVDGCVKAPEEDVGFALAAVTLFGTVALFAYPAALGLLHLSTRFYALWTGASVHEVAQVAAAASVLDPDGQALASTVKLLRVVLILPITLGLSFFPRIFGLGTRESGQETSAAAGGTPRKVSVPWFAVAFFAVSLVFSFPILPPGVTKSLLAVDNVLLTAAMVALGLGIRFAKFRSLDARSLWLGLLPTVFLSSVTALAAWVATR